MTSWTLSSLKFSRIWSVNCGVISTAVCSSFEKDDIEGVGRSEMGAARNDHPAVDHAISHSTDSLPDRRILARRPVHVRGDDRHRPRREQVLRRRREEGRYWLCREWRGRRPPEQDDCRSQRGPGYLDRQLGSADDVVDEYRKQETRKQVDEDAHAPRQYVVQAREVVEGTPKASVGTECPLTWRLGPSDSTANTTSRTSTMGTTGRRRTPRAAVSAMTSSIGTPR